MNYQVSQITDLSKATLLEIETLADLSIFITATNWAPGTFKDGQRKNANFQTSDFIALDIDDGITISEFKARLDEKHLSYIIGTTKSHQVQKGETPPCDRFRVIIPLAARVKSEQAYSSIFNRLLNEFPMIDRNARDCARMFYPCKEIVHMVENGELLLPDIHLKDVLASQVGPVADLINKQLGNLSYNTKQFLANGAKPGEWNSQLFLTAKDFQQQGYNIDETGKALSLMKNKFFSGKLDYSDLRTITSAYNVPPKYDARLTKFGQELGLNEFSFTASRKASPAQLIEIIENQFNYNIWFNEMKSRPYLDNQPLNDDDEASIRTQLRALDFPFKDGFVSDTLRVLARQNRKHPFKDFVLSVPWDGRDRIEELFNTFELDVDSPELIPLYSLFLRRFLVALIARVFVPGTQNLVLTLKGPQGARKSTWLSRLDVVPGCYAEGPINPDNKDDKLRHLSQVIHHITELDATTKRDVNALKAFLTMDFISERKSYDRHNTDGKSRLSFVASVNSNDFLRDTTGNRRFLVIPVARLDANHNVNMQQLFAQCYTLYISGEQYWFDERENELINYVNEDYMPVGFHKEICARIFANESEVNNLKSYHDIITELGPNPKYSYSQAEVRNYLNELRNSKGHLVRKRDRTNGQDISKYNVTLTPFERLTGLL